jgi:hypothetical protein
MGLNLKVQFHVVKRRLTQLTSCGFSQVNAKKFGLQFASESQILGHESFQISGKSKGDVHKATDLRLYPKERSPSYDTRRAKAALYFLN